MTRVQPLSWRLALRFPAVVLALGAAVLLPAYVRWGGDASAQPVRLRLAALVLAALLATAWEDRCRSFLAALPVGLPAVRRGRALVVGSALAAGYATSCWVARDAGVPWAALHLQTAAVAVLVAAVVGRLCRDDSRSALVLPVPVLLLLGLAATRLPASLALFQSQPGDPGWPDERLRWCVVALLSLAVVAHLDRDPASPRRTWRNPS